MKYLILMILISGCEKHIPNPRESLLNYKCTSEQVDLVQKQYSICDESGYISSHCYLSATANNCVYQDPK